MEEVFESGKWQHYVEWRNKRFNFIEKYYKNKFGENFFHSKKMIEIGCGRGHLGRMFSHIGCEVTHLDGREEHINYIKQNYPESNVILHNCENDMIDLNYDIILHTGLLYHIQPIHVKKHLQQILNSNFKHLILETYVIDIDDDEYIQATKEKGEDQAISEIGCGMSANAVEKIIKNNNIVFQRFDNQELDSSPIHQYSWISKNTGLPGGRRLWLCEK